jgi:hypothetical protein
MTVHDELQKQKIAAEANAQGRQEWELEAERAVPTRLIRDIVADAYRGISQSTSLIPDRQRSEDKPRAVSGGTVPIQPPPGIEIIDRLCQAQDRADRAAAIRVRIETELVEAAMANKVTYKAKTEYNPVQRFDDETPSCHREKS